MNEKDFNEAIKNKLSQFKERDINIESEDIKKYLDNFYFKEIKLNKKSLNEFILDNNIDKIINYLMSDAIINPEF